MAIEPDSTTRNAGRRIWEPPNLSVARGLRGLGRMLEFRRANVKYC